MHYHGIMTTLEAVLADLDITTDDLAVIMHREAVAGGRAGATPLPASLHDFLTRTTSSRVTGQVAIEATQILANREYAELRTAQHRALQAAGELARSLSTKEVAARLGKSTTTITRAAGRSLYAYSDGRGLRFPAWQFDDAQPLPGLASVVPQLGAGLSPAAVEARMTSQDAETLGGLSAIEWLRRGGDPAEVVRILAEQDKW